MKKPEKQEKLKEFLEYVRTNKALHGKWNVEVETNDVQRDINFLYRRGLNDTKANNGPYNGFYLDLRDLYEAFIAGSRD